MSDLIERLRQCWCDDGPAIVEEAADRIAELEAELTEWEKLKDPINLHVNLLWGVPCRLDRMQHLLHLAGATDYDDLKAANDKMRKCLESIAAKLAELESDVKFWNDAFLEQRASAEKEVARLNAAITKTLNENGHLADGEDCTLIELKRAMGVSHE